MSWEFKLVEAARIELASRSYQQQPLRACLIHFSSHCYLCKLAMPDNSQLLNFASFVTTPKLTSFYSMSLPLLSQPDLKANRLQRLA